ncbi:MAG: preprotein translocase subunit SecG [Pirellulales bacterium]|nr:preprotein translocase subunit SecG [Pirellulales bacterium]
MLNFLFPFLMGVIAVFLILLVLVQRGRGGGLAGALGGAGGSSAFGAKAGDTFTRITFVTVTIWIILCAAALAHFSGKKEGGGLINVKTQAPADPGGSITAPPADDKPAGATSQTNGTEGTTPPAGNAKS